MLLDPIIKGRTGNPLLPELKKQIYAHRGYHDKPQIPENSLPAFKRAIENGWGAELDVHILKDGTLAVFHDSELKRCAGVDGIIEDLDRAQLKELRLEGTDNTVPLFDEVLALFENATPLIIELKTYKGNHRALAEAVCRRLDSYKGLYCIESFDPRAIADVRELRPGTCTGQLSQDFEKEPSGLPRYQRIILTNLLFNVKTRPDFIAYRFEDRFKKNNQRVVKKLGVQEVNWTIRSKKDFDECIRAGSIPIFEKFDPRE
ncbi:MAG: glycerophosphodiester phosphodiesterase [Firmicutes bacterium]|nr:glycerophosphodiester phosphodiesterase [Bacillota bacterium]